MRLQITNRGLLIAALALVPVALVAQTRPQPGTKLPLNEIEAQMFHVSAGKRLKPKAWPNGARVAVGLSFDVDNATADLATGNLISESISRGEYGAVEGVPRILRLLGQDASATFKFADVFKKSPQGWRYTHVIWNLDSPGP